MLRRLWVGGLLALALPLAYAIGGWRNPGFGRPFMITYLFGPESSHTTIGLILLMVGKIICPLIATVSGIALLRLEHSRRRAWILVVAGLILLLLNLATRQPCAG